MNIIGIGIVFAGGRGVSAYERVLRKGYSRSFYSVPKEAISDKEITSRMRRADRFSKIAAIAAYDAVIDSKISTKSLGIIVSTGFGPHTTTFRFLDDILDYGERGVSPTIFSHSVHNAAVSYVSTLLGSQGPTLTITDFSFPFHQALIIAKSWLDQGRCEYMLVGGVDERGEVMEYICRQKLSVTSGGKLNPFTFSSRSQAVPGEGSLFLVLTNKESADKYCSIKDISLNAQKDGDVDMRIIDTDGIIVDERAYQDLTDPGIRIGGYSALFGSMINTSAFNCAAGALMIKNQVYYGCWQENPFNLNIPKETDPAEIKKIQCLRCDCDNRKASIKLEVD